MEQFEFAAGTDLRLTVPTISAYITMSYSLLKTTDYITSCCSKYLHSFNYSDLLVFVQSKRHIPRFAPISSHSERPAARFHVITINIKAPLVNSRNSGETLMTRWSESAPQRLLVKILK